MDDADLIDPGSFFTHIKKRMEKLTDDGKIRKKVTRKGKGLTPPPTAIVSILYTTYLEDERKPLDVTYLRKPLKFQLDNTLFVGLNYAVLSMKITETSLFFIHHDFPFGKMIASNENSQVWVLIELLKFSDTKLDSIYDKITIKEIKFFSSAQELTLALMDNAKFLMGKNISIAMREYQKAYKMLSRAKLKDDYEQYEQRRLKIRILTNLVICFNKENYPRKACILCNEIYKIAYRPFIPLPAKVYFNHGKALFAYGDYKASLKKFLKAQKLEPHNRKIMDEVSKAGFKVAQERERDRKLAKIYLESEKDVNRRDNSTKTNEDTDDDCNAFIQTAIFRYVLQK